MFARFNENPAMILQDIKETKCYGRTDGRTDNVKTVYPLQTKFAGGIINGNNVLVQRKFTCPKQQRTHKDLCLAHTKVKLSKLFDLIFSNLAISLNMCFVIKRTI